MSSEKTEMTEVERATLDFVEQHRGSYIASGGAEGHILDYTHLGGHFFTTCLLLETTGRKSGERRVTPLIYGDIGGEVVVIASKGGADIHPGWYWNLQEMTGLRFQIATQAFTASWREPDEAERAKVWEFMCSVYPPYIDYQDATSRQIPLVMLKPLETQEAFKA